MKKILSMLAFISVFLFTGVQTLYAQYPHIHIYWDEPEDCDCSVQGDFFYRIDAVIVNECGEEFYTEWENFEIVPGTASYVDFYPDWSCDNPSNDPCYLVTGMIRKLCPDGLGGFTVQCVGKPNELRSCYSLMHQTVQAQIEWE